ncbi:MAG: gliding motility-associated ABC transporter ATP-binding subunit GldA [Bacteroidetes bacterium]|nr:gliding motility-associated ABC transporter ATP-binding subunit GldA [Bacteroidota bacterium]
MSIEVLNLSKYFGNQAAVDDISFTVKKGEILGFLGPNGAGKSTTMKIMVGYIRASSGEVRINGQKVDVDNLETRKVIGYLPENNPLYTEMYVREYLEFIGKIYKIKNVRQRVDEMIEAVGLEAEQNKKIGLLSKGYKQRVGLAQALIHNPSVLILDEPTSGLDPNQIAEIRTLIKRLGKEKTVILSTHIMQEAEATCDKIIIISKGKLVANNSAAALKDYAAKQTVYVEYDETPSKTELTKIPHVSKVKELNNGWLIETSEDVDLRKAVASHAQQKRWLVLTLQVKNKSLEEVFRELTQ